MAVETAVKSAGNQTGSYDLASSLPPLPTLPPLAYGRHSVEHNKGRLSHQESPAMSLNMTTVPPATADVINF